MLDRLSLPSFRLPPALARHADLVGAAFLAAIVALLIFPIPAFLLDLFICANFCMSFLILTSSLYISRPTQFTAFPSVLLLSTLLRLSLAIASTKMILLHAHAGEVIQAFGSVVAGGNIVVGLVVFVLLCAIQFIVVAKGADRVAEVAARFTLDGIPGRQMSIDADLRSGAISADAARAARRKLEQETYLYGSLDGAMKFVKGDAVAGLVVALVNIVAGLAIGMTMRAMPFAEALHTYTILTVGDGIVSQIPSLMATVAAGIVMTRVSGSDDAASHLGQDIVRQLTSRPKVFAITGCACFALAAIPDFATLSFALAGAAMFAIGLAARRPAAGSQAAQDDTSPVIPELTRDGGNYELHLLDTVELGTCDPLRLRVGEQALAAIDPTRLGPALADARRRLMMSIGLPFPGLAVSGDAALEPYLYALDVDDMPVAHGTLVPGRVLVSAPGGTLAAAADAVEGRAPDRRQAIWMLPDEAQHVSAAEVSTFTAEQTLAAHVEHVCQVHADKFAGTQETRFLLDQLAISFPDLVAQASERVSTLRLSGVLSALLRERVVIRNLRAIVEAVARVPDADLNEDRMLREVRIALGAQICAAYLEEGGRTLPVAVIDAQWEAVLETRLRMETDGEPHLILSAEESAALADALQTLPPECEVLLTSAVLRPHFARRLQHMGMPASVLAREEVPRDFCSIRHDAVIEAAGDIEWMN